MLDNCKTTYPAVSSGEAVKAGQVTGNTAVSAAQEPDFMPIGLEGDALDYLEFNRLMVYTDIPFMRLPLAEDLNWEVAVTDFTTRETETLKLDYSHVDVYPDKRYALFDLADLSLFNSFVAGHVGVTVKQAGQIWRSAFAYIPEIRMEFLPEIVFPDECLKKYTVKLFLPEYCKPRVDYDAVIVPAGNFYNVYVNGRCSEFTLKLQYIDQIGPSEVKVSVRLPRVTWALAEEKPRYYADEIWWGDWKEKEKIPVRVFIPGNTAKYVRVRPGKRSRYQEVPLNNQFAGFDLKEFGDCFNANGLTPILLELLDGKRKVVKTGTLLYVRSKWEIKDLTCHTLSPSAAGVVRLSWTENGKAAGKELRCWRLDRPWLPPLTTRLDSAECNLTIDLKEKGFGPEPLLLEIAEIDPGNGVIPQFPRSIKGCVQVIPDQPGPKAESLEVVWQGAKSAKIRGRVLNARKKTTVTVYLLGIVAGEPQAVVTTASIDKNGWFTAHIRDGKARRYAHWVGVTVDQYGCFSILEEPAYLEWPLDRPEAVILFDKPGARVKVTAEGFQLRETVQSPEVSRHILGQWGRGPGSADCKIALGDELQTVRLSWKNAKQASINVVYYVCTSCNEIVPSQQYWGRYHYPRCKSINVRGRHELAVRLSLVWQFNEVLQKLKEKYPLARPFVMNLHNAELPASLLETDGINHAAAVRWLWEKEFDIVKALEE